MLGVIFAAAADDRTTGFAVTADEAAPVADAGRAAQGTDTGDVRLAPCALTALAADVAAATRAVSAVPGAPGVRSSRRGRPVRR